MKFDFLTIIFITFYATFSHSEVPQIEPIWGFQQSQDGVEVTVLSEGCSVQDDFTLNVTADKLEKDKTYAGRLASDLVATYSITVLRIKEDSCRARETPLLLKFSSKDIVKPDLFKSRLKSTEKISPYYYAVSIKNPMNQGFIGTYFADEASEEMCH